MNSVRRESLRIAFIRIARLYCMGDPNVRGQLRTLHVLKALRKQHLPDIADAGCGRSGKLGWLDGIAYIAFPICRLHRESRVLGFDIDPSVVRANADAAVRAGLENLSFEVADIFSLGDQRRFDLVIFSDIARDLRRDGDFVRRVAEMVKPGGRLVMICPSRYQLIHHSKFERRATGSGFTTDDLRLLVASCGLDLETVRHILGPLAGRMALAGMRTAAVHYALLVIVFPFLMTAAFLDLFTSPQRGDALLVIGRRPGMA